MSEFNQNDLPVDPRRGEEKTSELEEKTTELPVSDSSLNPSTMKNADQQRESFSAEPEAKSAGAHSVPPVSSSSQQPSAPVSSPRPNYTAYTQASSSPELSPRIVKRYPKWPAVVSGFAGALVGCAVMSGVVFGLHPHLFNTAGHTQQQSAQTVATQQNSEQHAALQTVSAQNESQLAQKVAEKSLKSVVSIDTVAVSKGRQSQSVGSGVILDKEGHIITNNHVVDGATSITVNVNNKSYEAKVIGADPSSDLAVIKIDASDLTPIEIGDSDNLKVGQWVMAIGSPFGLEQSVSTGILSSLYRSTTMMSTDGYSIYTNMIQTDAAINPGNSGGALVDEQGKLIGINTLIESASGSSSGVGFAIPVKYAKKVADCIIAGKPVTHAYLGVSLDSVTPYSAYASGLSTQSGAFVAEVTDGSPAAQAGLKKGDIIVALDDEQIQGASDLILKVRSHEVGDKVKLGVVRNKETQTIEVTLGSDDVATTTSSNQSQEKGKTPKNDSQEREGDRNNTLKNPFDLYEKYHDLFNGE